MSPRGCSVLAGAVLLGGLAMPAQLPHALPARAADPAGWSVRDMGLTALTHDTVCNQYDQATITRLVGYIPQFHANYASDDVPLDDASGYGCTPGPLSPYAYMKAWADALHAAGLHVMYRGNWNHWAGDYGEAKLSYTTSPAIPYESSGGLQAVLSGQDDTSYIGMTYQWILHHADLFQDGDIFEPFGEPQNNGIANCAAQDGYGSCYGTSAYNCPNGICQFPDVTSFNRWLSDFAQADQAAFATTGKQVTSGWFGVAADTYKYTTAATWQHAGEYNMDHFAQSYASWTGGIQNSHSAMPGLPITMEWGDVNDADDTAQLVANTTDQYMAYAASQPYITGFEYWYLAGRTPGARSAALDLDTGQMTPAGQVVARWFATMSPGASPLPTAIPTSPVSAPSATPTSPVPVPSATPSAAPKSASSTATPLSTPSAGAVGQITYVQGTALLGSGLALTSVYPQAVRAGDLLVGAFRTQHGTTVHDDRNGAWQLAADCGVVSIWYVADARPGVTTVGESASAGGQLRMALAEYSGVAGSTPLTATSCASRSSASVSTAGTAMVGVGDLAFATVGTGSTPITVRAGAIGTQPAVLREQVTGSVGTIADEDVTATAGGSQTASLTLSEPGGWTAGLAIFSHS